MKAPIIADSSALISLVSSGDDNNSRALARSEQYARERRTVLIPDDVFTETLNVLGRRLARGEVMPIAERLLDPEQFTHVDTTPEIRAQALTMFAIQPTSVSFTDCLVIAVADHYETRIIFGFDQVFRKNGYQMEESTAT